MRIVAIAIISAVIGICVPSVGASTSPVPASAVGVASGQAFRAGWYEDITGECDNIRDAAVGLFGVGSGGSGSLAFATGTGLVGAAPSTATGAGFLGTFGAGSALVTGGQLLAVAAVGTTAFCTGLLGAQWISGNTPYDVPVYNGPFFTLNENGAIPCQQISGLTEYWPVSMCQRFSPAGASLSIPRFNQYGEYIEGNQGGNFTLTHTALHFGTPNNFGATYPPSVYRSSYLQGSEQGQQVTVEIDCRTLTICAFEPNTANSWLGVAITGGATLPINGAPSMPTPQRLNARAYCQSPAGSTQLFSSSGPWSNGVESATNPDSVLCPAGWLRLTYNLDIQTLGSQYRTSDSLITMPDLAQIPAGGESLISWVIPTYVQSNPVLRQCYLDGFTNCEATTTAGVTTITNVITNQTTNVNVPGPQTTLGEALQPVRDAIDAVVTTPTTVPIPSTVPTTVPVPTTLPNPTTVPPPTTIPTPTPDGPPPPPPVADGDGGWGSCMDDQTSGASTDSGWSFASVGKYVVQWMVAPIICAAYWLVVPPGGWEAEWVMLSGTLWGLPLFQTFAQYADVIDISLSNCVPIGFHPEIMNHDFGTEIDVGLCGDTVVNAIFMFLIGLGVLGVLYSGLKSVTSMSNKSSDESDSTS